jgi:uridylate kinase
MEGNTRMNALELADALEAIGTTEVVMCDAATMLRQQAAEIEAGIKLVRKLQEEREALKKENDHLLMVHNYKGAGFR